MEEKFLETVNEVNGWGEPIHDSVKGDAAKKKLMALLPIFKKHLKIDNVHFDEHGSYDGPEISFLVTDVVGNNGKYRLSQSANAVVTLRKKGKIHVGVMGHHEGGFEGWLVIPKGKTAGYGVEFSTPYDGVESDKVEDVVKKFVTDVENMYKKGLEDKTKYIDIGITKVTEKHFEKLKEKLKTGRFVVAKAAKHVGDEDVYLSTNKNFRHDAERAGDEIEKIFGLGKLYIAKSIAD